MKGLLISLGCILVFSCQVFAFEPFFEGRVDYSTEGAALSELTGDFNADGILDFAVSNNDGYLKFLYGNGDGTFNYVNDSVYCGLRPYFLGTGRFNSDHIPDYITVCQPYQNALYTIMSDGSGSFSFAQPPQVWPSEYHLGIIDIDNDGFDDLLYSDYNTTLNKMMYRVVYCNGDGTFDFQSADTAWIPTETYGKQFAFDINHDEYMDILVYGSVIVFPDSSDLSIYEMYATISTIVNNGDGTFQSPVDYIYGVEGDYFTGLWQGDFNNDGEIDLMTLDNHRVLAILKNNGDGSFTNRAGLNLSDSLHCTVGDFNADGSADIAFSYAHRNEFSIIINDGGEAFTFGAEQFYPGKALFNNAYGLPLFSGDLNSDSYDDIYYASGLLSLVLNNGDGTFPSAAYIYDGLSDQAISVLDMDAKDFNNDGAPDLILIDSSRVFLCFNDGSGEFGSPHEYSSGLGQRGLVTGDFNSDNYTDFGVVGTGSPEGFIVFYGGPVEGEFTPQPILEGGTYTANGGIAAELNGDGRIDFAFYRAASGVEVQVIKSFETDLWQLNGYSLYGIVNQVIYHMQAIDGADLDNDGHTDLIGGGMDSTLYLMFNDGQAGFNTVDTIPLNSFLWDIETADYNNDGAVDVAIGGANEILVYFGNGDGTFRDPVQATDYYYAAYYKTLASADMDRDGDMDIVALTVMNIDEVVVIPNNGDGTFAPAQYYPGGASCLHMAVADFNLDSKIDVAVSGDKLDGIEGAIEVTVKYNTAAGCDGVDDFDLDGISDPCDNCPHHPNFLQEDSNHDGIGDSCQFAIPTGAGSDVVLNLGYGITITFDSVETPGTTSASIRAAGGNSERFDVVPGNLPYYLYVATDVSYVGNVTICFTYSDEYVDGIDESLLSFIHHDNGEWVDITSSLDTASNTVCGTTGSLSPFALAIPKTPADVDDGNWTVLPTDFNLAQNYPNPFNPTTTIQFSLNKRSSVKLSIYNLLGQKVKTLVDREEGAGNYIVTWDGKSDSGEPVATGIYLYRFQAGEHVETRKMLLLK